MYQHSQITCKKGLNAAGVEGVQSPKIRSRNHSCRCQADVNGSCPNVTSNDPYLIGFAVDGVTAVFKVTEFMPTLKKLFLVIQQRFYFGHCQMQFLFSRDLGRKLMQALQSVEQAEVKNCTLVNPEPYEIIRTSYLGI